MVAFMFALHASDVLNRFSYWVVYSSVDFATVANSELQTKVRVKQVSDMLLVYLYFAGGLIIPLLLFPWGRLRIRLLTCSLLLVVIMLVCFILAGSVF